MGMPHGVRVRGAAGGLPARDVQNRAPRQAALDADGAAPSSDHADLASAVLPHQAAPDRECPPRLPADDGAHDHVAGGFQVTRSSDGPPPPRLSTHCVRTRERAVRSAARCWWHAERRTPRRALAGHASWGLRRIGALARAAATSGGCATKRPSTVSRYSTFGISAVSSSLRCSARK
eukprot:7388276-Prymnesium_polylepis.1